MVTSGTRWSMCGSVTWAGFASGAGANVVWSISLQPDSDRPASSTMPAIMRVPTTVHRPLRSGRDFAGSGALGKMPGVQRPEGPPHDLADRDDLADQGDRPDQPAHQPAHRRQAAVGPADVHGRDRR